MRSRYIIVAGATLIASSPFLVSFVQHWEADKRDPSLVYADKLAQGLPTVCSGITRHITDTPIVVGDRWPPEKCEAEKAAALAKVQLQIAGCFKVAPPQEVFDMATSHAWNFGAPATCSSAAMRAWNAADWETGCRRMTRGDDGRIVWAYVRTGRIVNGKPELKFVQGLHNRRNAEADICANGWPG